MRGNERSGDGTIVRFERPGALPMPTIAWFYGIAIRMYFKDHPPPHFEAVYGEFEANVAIACDR